MTTFPHSTSLNAARRRRELDGLDGLVDVLVIGGGITGAGVALDAASRGLSVVLAERGDLAQGTSRWSSKLIHGGLRYLASGDVRLAHESAVERGILLSRTAPHLVRALPMVFPRYARGGTIRAGLLAGDALRRAAGTRRAELPPSRRISSSAVRRWAPAVSTRGLRDGLLGFDGQLSDDARLVVAVARSAAGFGARILTRCAVTSADGEGAVLTDALTGTSVHVRARAVISATGVWAGELDPSVAVTPSRGTHVVLRSSRFGGLPAALMVPVSRSRFVFALPAADGRVYAGVTDEPVPELPDGDPLPPAADVEWLLRAFDPVLSSPLDDRDVIGAYTGFRPLLPGAGAGPTADLSRRHLVRQAPNGLISVVGGKLTTYRRMAEDAVDLAVSTAGLRAGRCRTRRLPLAGAVARRDLPGTAAPARLVARYGSEAPAIWHGDRTPVAPGLAVTAAELRFAVDHEGALDAADLLDRRTRIGLVAHDRAAGAAAAERAMR